MKLQENRSLGSKRSRSEMPLSAQEEKHNCQRKKTQEEVPEITFSTEDNPGIPSGIERGKAFWLQEAKLQTNRTHGLKRSRSETSSISAGR